ncbi:DEAD/DEAH box helicase family protein [bacterium]|nr:DEAD/DEAH box helicase family protein [bacterium]
MSAPIHQEINFENEILEYMTQNGWLEGQDKNYNREYALYPEDLLGWIQDSQPKEFEKLVNRYGDQVEKKLCASIAKNLDKHGALHVLRHTTKDVNAKIKMCQFKPGHNLNPDVIERYNKVRLRVVRQVHYSLHNQNSIDLVLFLNGIPIATIELKTDFTQSVEDAKKQYRIDRPPRDKKTNSIEPLLSFKQRALVHFAVSSSEVFMTTHLQGNKTYFLPFNKGNDEGKGNPPNPNGYQTSYLWEEVLARDTLINIVGNFLHLQKETTINEKGIPSTKETLIFPRYHQLEVVNNLVKAAKDEGPGKSYLIQHSAGSGKSNSIAWIAHRLSSLHNNQNEKVFDSAIVITDRQVLDSQLQDTIYQFEHKAGVVCCIDRKANEGSKSQQLTKALLEKTPIIIVTIQTFPYILDSIKENASLKERNFAVIIDEAHSSQSGSTASKIREVLTSTQVDSDSELTSEDILHAIMASRQKPQNISYFAFTATPKPKTLELFGRISPTSEIPKAFHVYTMQQAIEEGFILDVLARYTTFKTAFKLSQASEKNKEVDSKKATKELMRWFRLHPYNISQKVQVIVEHFRANVSQVLGGKAKAMVVTSSRKEAIRYKVAMDKYIKENDYQKLHTMIAFSGSLKDSESGPEEFTEKNMNPGLKGRTLPEAFSSPDYQVMIVANKFQTGFDQPLLCAMYVDKQLSGVLAVQTLSRLNRCYPGKPAPFVLDFVNSEEEVLLAFQVYNKTATLAGVTDPNIIHELQLKLDEYQLYTESEIDIFAKAYYSTRCTQAALDVALAPVKSRYYAKLNEANQKITTAKENLKQCQSDKESSTYKTLNSVLSEVKENKDALKVFKKDITSFVRLYDFLSQIIVYDDIDLEKRNVFFRHLSKLIKGERESEAIDIDGLELTHYRLQKLAEKKLLLGDEDEKLYPGNDIGSGKAKDPKLAYISELLEKLNEIFSGDLTNDDKLSFITATAYKLLEDDELKSQSLNNSMEQFALGSIKEKFINAVIENLGANGKMAEQVLSQERVQASALNLVMQMVFNGFNDPSSLRDFRG